MRVRDASLKSKQKLGGFGASGQDAFSLRHSTVSQQADPFCSASIGY